LLTAHVVAHTHWDREWYQPFVRFRQRLVALVDELLDDPPAADESFLLDGQAVVIEDYLEVRPERAAELASLLRDGRLEAGPWYVLADELIPAGESLVRNLLLGRRIVRRYGASSPPVLYCPDSFGHPATLPMIAAGFGLALIILWRGFGGRRWPPSDTVIWRAPDGERVAVYHLPPSGYEYGSDLPLDPAAARERWRRMRDTYAPRTATGIVLLPNGADHHARQRGQREAVQLLAQEARATGDELSPSSLGAFVEQLLTRARDHDLPEIQGELRDSYGYTWTLQGTFATRAMQKRANARTEKALLRDAEPWAAIAKARGSRSRLPLLVSAWRTLLQTHPHDTLCGCSIDAVAAAMEARLAAALAQATGIRDDAIADIIGYDADTARTTKAAWKPVVVVRNRAPRARHGVAIVELKQFVADIAVGPGSGAKRPADVATPQPLSLGVDVPIQMLSQRSAYDRLESSRHYPDNDLVTVTRAAVWLGDVPAYGLAAFPLGTGERVRSGPPNAVRGTDSSLENELVRVNVGGDGTITIADLATGRSLSDALIIEDRADVGDLYTPAIRGAAATPEFLGCAISQRGPILGELQLRWRLRSLRGRRRASDLAIRVQLVANSPIIRFELAGVNRDCDHRLRVGLRGDVASGSVWADAAFGAVQREPLPVPQEDRRDEIPPPTAPLHRYVSLFGETTGLTLISDGLGEYEASADGELFVTLLRAVGELSRNDLPERPGHAGWPAPTPNAQSRGRFGARLAIFFHGARSPDSIDAIERAADDFLLPLEGRTLRSALMLPPSVPGVELRGRGLAFCALKESEDGEWIVARCVNLLDEAVSGEWLFGFTVRDALLARLDESPLQPIAARGNVVHFHAPARAAVTILLR
jgi:alpha-mannosidase